MTSEVFTLLRNVPSLAHAPRNALIAIIVVAGVMVFFVMLLILFVISDFMRVEKVEHVAPDSHRLIMDLQKTLVQEMRGTAKQNSLMIKLTIIFLIVTIIGIVISVVGPSATIHFINRSIKHIMSLAPKAVKPAKELLGQ